MGVPQQYGHAVADAEGGGGEEGHTAGRDPQLEAADRAAAVAHAAQVAKYEHVTSAPPTFSSSDALIMTVVRRAR